MRISPSIAAALGLCSLAAPARAEGAGEEPRRTVHVTFNSDEERAQIERLDASGEWVTVCAQPGPCTLSAADGVYRVAGPGIVKSAGFQLPEGGSRVDAEVGTTTQTGWGVILMAGGGGLALFIGLPLLAIGAIASSADVDSGTETSGTGSAILVTGAVLTIGGLVASVAGLTMILDNGTKVTTAQHRPVPLLARTPGISPLGFTF